MYQQIQVQQEPIRTSDVACKIFGASHIWWMDALVCVQRKEASQNPYRFICLDSTRTRLKERKSIVLLEISMTYMADYRYRVHTQQGNVLWNLYDWIRTEK